MPASTLIGIFFLSMLLKYAFDESADGILLYTRRDGRQHITTQLKAKPKICKVMTREMLFADEAAVVLHTDEG